jgi:hypothetical protein
VAFDDDALTLSTALLINDELDDPTVPIVMRVWTEGGLAQLLDGEGAGAYSGLHPFPVLDRSCTTEIVTGGVREQLARSIHEDYVATVGASGDGYARAWDDLTDAERESSRRRAEHLCQQLALLEWDLVPLRHWDAPAPLDADVVTAIAVADHERWRQDRRDAGWREGPTRDDAARTNPYLVAWEELPEPIREQNRAGVRALPEQLARAGLELERSRSGRPPASDMRHVASP